METEIIRIEKELFEDMIKLKNPSESIEDLLKRLIKEEREKRTLEFLKEMEGILDITDEEADNLIKEIYNKR